MSLFSEEDWDEIFSYEVKKTPKIDKPIINTPERHMEDDEEIEASVYDTFPTHINKRPEPNPFIVNPQGTKHNRDVKEEDDDEYNADQTIVGGKHRLDCKCDSY